MGYLTRVEDAAASIFFDSDKVLALAAASTLLAGAKLKSECANSQILRDTIDESP